MKISDLELQQLDVSIIIKYLDYSTKDLLYAKTIIEEDPQVQKLYKITHGHTLPGEQKDRNYDWNLDKNKHVFGKADNIEQDGAKKSLRTDMLFSEYPKTKIGEKRLEDYRQATSELLGKGKFKGTLNPSISADFTYGVKSMKDGTWNVGKCIFGDSESNLNNKNNLDTDIDLGKSVNLRSKNPKLHPNEKVDHNKIFGVPSVRYDLVEKEKKSVCDYKVFIYLIFM